MSQLADVLTWGFIATLLLTLVLYGSQGLGLTRLSLPFLLGTLFTSNRSLATFGGFVAYIVGGWFFAFIYYLLFLRVGVATWWVGALFGLMQAMLLLVVMLPVLPFIHPRMASEYDGPSEVRRLEPPGFLGLNYGWRTPFSTTLGHVVYGAILGLLYRLPGPVG